MTTAKKSRSLRGNYPGQKTHDGCATSFLVCLFLVPFFLGHLLYNIFFIHVHHGTRPNLVEFQKLDLFDFPLWLPEPVGLQGKSIVRGNDDSKLIILLLLLPEVF